MPALSLAHTIRFLATKPCSRPAHVSSNRCRQSMNTNRMVPSLECAFAQPRNVDRNEVNSASDISPGRRREFFVTDLAEAGHIAVNADIEGWVGQDQIGPDRPTLQ